MGNSGRPAHITKAIGAFLAFAVLLGAIGPANAFPAEVLESVVSVLPDWPSNEPLPERPEGSGVAVLAGSPAPFWTPIEAHQATHPSVRCRRTNWPSSRAPTSSSPIFRSPRMGC